MSVNPQVQFEASLVGCWVSGKRGGTSLQQRKVIFKGVDVVTPQQGEQAPGNTL